MSDLRFAFRFSYLNLKYALVNLYNKEKGNYSEACSKLLLNLEQGFLEEFTVRIEHHFSFNSCNLKTFTSL